jgi:hypothetical protein
MKVITTFFFAAVLIGCQINSSTPSDLSSGDSLEIEQRFRPVENDVLKPTFDDNKIHGFGILKIGCSEDSVLSIFRNEYHYKLLTFSDDKKLLRFSTDNMFDKNSNISYGDYIIKTLPPAKTTDFYQIDNTFWCPEISTFFLLHYKINTVDIPGLYLIFYKRKLSKMMCDYSGDLENAVRAKYGDPTHNLSGSGSSIGYFNRVWANGTIKFQISSDLGCELGIKNVNYFFWAKDSVCRNQRKIIEQAELRSKNKDF